MSKFLNCKTKGFASKREYRRAQELELLQKIGEISDLDYQVPFELIPKQVDERGKLLERAVTYVCDFRYKEAGKNVVEDCKGFRTKDYILKRKLLLWRHGIRIRET